MDKHFDSLIKPRLDKLKPLTLLEIGVCEGATTLPLLRWCRDNDARLTSLDPVAWSGNLPEQVKQPYQDYVFKYGESGALPTISAPYLEEACGEGLLDYWDCKKITSLDYLKQASESFDAVFLDGDHNFFTVYNELTLIAPRLNAGGNIFLHDVSDKWSRVDQYYDIRSIPTEYVNGAKQGVLTAVEAFLKDFGGVERGRLVNAEALTVWLSQHPIYGLTDRLKGAARIILRGSDDVWLRNQHLAFQKTCEDEGLSTGAADYVFEILSARHFGLGLISKAFN